MSIAEKINRVCNIVIPTGLCGAMMFETLRGDFAEARSYVRATEDFVLATLGENTYSFMMAIADFVEDDPQANAAFLTLLACGMVVRSINKAEKQMAAEKVEHEQQLPPQRIEPTFD